MSIFSSGPRHRWFAWHPVRTDCGWRWLRPVVRYRTYVDVMGSPEFWTYELPASPRIRVTAAVHPTKPLLLEDARLDHVDAQ